MRRSDQRLAAVFVCYQIETTGRDADQVLDRAARNRELAVTQFCRDLVLEVDSHRQELDVLISRHSIDWTVDRIAPLELSVLRVALCEIVYRDDIPLEVSIDEAVEIAKNYCGTDSPAFINGVLGGVAKEVAAH